MEKFRWGRGKSVQAEQAVCHHDIQQQAGCLTTEEEENVFVFGVAFVSHPSTVPCSAGSLPLPACLPGASMEATVSSLLLLQPLSRGDCWTNLAHLGAGKYPLSSPCIADLTLLRRGGITGSRALGVVQNCLGHVHGDGRRGGGTRVPKLGCDHETRLPPGAGFMQAKYFSGRASHCLPHRARYRWIGMM